MAACSQIVLPPGYATTSDAARSRRGHHGLQRGTSSCRYRCQSRRWRCRLFETWPAPCLRGRLPALIAGGAGARPDHSISRLDRRNDWNRYETGDMLKAQILEFDRSYDSEL